MSSLKPASTAAFCDLTMVDTLMGAYARPKQHIIAWMTGRLGASGRMGSGPMKVKRTTMRTFPAMVRDFGWDTLSQA